MQSNRKKYQYLVLPLNPSNQQKDWKKKSRKKKKAQARRESIEKVDQFRSCQRMSGQKQAIETALQRKKNAVFCHDWQTKELQNSTSVVFVKWGKCDFCDHLTHLQYCTPVRVLRRGDTFKCSHCENNWKKMNKNSVMFITFSSCSVFFYL